MKSVTAALCVLALIAPAARAETPTVKVELNKLEAQEGACQAFLVIENGTENAFDALILDLVMFNPGGVIARRLAVDIAPLRPGRTSVKVFAVQGLDCDQIGRLLVNDVLDCSTAAGAVEGCLELVETASRAGVEMIN